METLYGYFAVSELIVFRLDTSSYFSCMIQREDDGFTSQVAEDIALMLYEDRMLLEVNPSAAYIDQHLHDHERYSFYFRLKLQIFQQIGEYRF